MKSKIILLNCMRYVKKKDGKETPLTRIQFLFAEYKQSENYIGAEPITCYYKGHGAFNLITEDMLLKPIDAEFKEIKDYYNPLSTRQILKSINGVKLD